MGTSIRTYPQSDVTKRLTHLVLVGDGHIHGKWTDGTDTESLFNYDMRLLDGGHRLPAGERTEPLLRAGRGESGNWDFQFQHFHATDSSVEGRYLIRGEDTVSTYPIYLIWPFETETPAPLVLEYTAEAQAASIAGATSISIDTVTADVTPAIGDIVIREVGNDEYTAAIAAVAGTSPTWTLTLASGGLTDSDDSEIALVIDDTLRLTRDTHIVASNVTQRREVLKGILRNLEQVQGLAAWDAASNDGLRSQVYARWVEMMARAASVDANLSSDDMYYVINADAVIPGRVWYANHVTASWDIYLPNDRTGWLWWSTAGVGNFDNQGNRGAGGTLGEPTAFPKNAGGTVTRPALDLTDTFDWVSFLG